MPRSPAITESRDPMPSRSTSRAVSRRRLLGTAAATAVLCPTVLRGGAAGSRIRVAVMGLGGRGQALATRFHSTPNTEVVGVADVDRDRAGKTADALAKLPPGTTPRVEADFRRFLDDRSIDLVVVATCNHWHAPATILACQAGKHVYVEKPCSHNPWEGEMMVAAAKKHDRRVQMGNQRRSWEAIRKAIAELHAGVIGRLSLAQAFYGNLRGSIGRGKEGPLPPRFDWDLWQGPATRRPFRTNYVHYNWHWFWHWGNGELGNNGIHFLDLCRWGLGVGHPVRVDSTGGRYHHDDDQETPDTQLATFTFEGGRTITWEGLSCVRRPADSGRRADIVFFGDKGSLSIDGSGYTIHDPAGAVVRTEQAAGGDAVHTDNLLAAIREGTPLASGIDEAHASTLLCHLGNISQRVGRSLACDPADGRIRNDAEAMALWKREYAAGWEPAV